MDKNKRELEKWIADYYNKKIDSILGELDIETIYRDELESLYYIFPLMEKIVVTLASNYDIECYQQGTIRTVNSIMKNNNEIFDTETTQLINKYFDENGLRNTILHPTKKHDVTVQMKEVQHLLSLLLKKLTNDWSIQDIKDIELFE